MATLFRLTGLRSLVGLRILDLGCGRGGLLRQLFEYGAEPARLFGVDLLKDRVQEGHRLSPNLHLVQGNAAHLPFPDNSFDLLLQFTLFTSVLDDGLKHAIATEIARVLVPRGKLLWYDFSYNNPTNPDVRGVQRSEFERLFPGWQMVRRRVTLAPPLARIVGRTSEALYHALARIPLLCTHYICLFERPG